MRRSLWHPFPVLLAACLFFCGCAAPLSDSRVPASVSGAAEAQPAPESAPTPQSGNPVWLFYRDFYSCAQDLLDEFHGALALADSPEALEGELLLSALEERLTEGMISFGLLMSADTGEPLSGGNYASSVEGAAAGNGSITVKGSGASLSFTYADGAVLLGSLTPYRLRYTRQAPEQAPEYSLLLLRSPKGWAAMLNPGNGPSYALRSGAEEIGLYALGYFAPQEAAAPGPAPMLITYDTCAEGAVQSWLYAKGQLSVSSLK